MIQLDGSYGEGGGALIRTALALSTLTGKPFSVDNIRQGRPSPGLKAQHLTALTALKEMSQARFNQVQLGSTHLTFTPGKIKPGKYTIDIGTAGSISLLLQALIIPCLFSKVKLEVIGGTCGKWQASVDYLQNIFLPHLQQIAKIDLKILKRGYFPKGGGKIQVALTPKYDYSEFLDLANEGAFSLNLAKDELHQIRGIVNASSELQDKQVTTRIAKSAQNSLKSLQVPISIREEYANSFSVGGEVLLWGVVGDKPTYIAGDALVEKGKSSEEIGQTAANKLQEELAYGVDCYLADQLISLLALIPGSFTVREVSNHVKTNIYVAEQFLDVKFRVEKNQVSSEILQ